MLKYVGPLLIVEDIQRSRRFYEEVLEQKVQMDFGVDIAFEGNFAIHQKAHFQELMGGPERFPIQPKANTGEIFFEASDLEAMEARLIEAGVEFLHPITEQPWAQRVLRVYDPDGHVLEIGEEMDATLRRLHNGGMSIEEVVRKTAMPEEHVRRVIGSR